MPEWGGDRQSPSRKSDPKLCLWIATVLTFSAIAIASGWMSGPIMHADEGGYLLNAAAIAGRLHSSVILGSYYSGYSLFIAPAWILLSDPGRIYHASLIINGLLLAAVPVGLYRLLSALFPQSLPRIRLLAALAGAWQAPVLAMSQLALSESALIAVYVWSLALAARTIRNHSKYMAFMTGAAAGYLFLIHPRGALLATPVIALMALHAFRNRLPLMWISALIAGALIMTALHWPLELLAGKYGAPQGANYDVERLSRELLQSFTWSRFAADLVGALVYALASSVTFVALGMPSRSENGRSQMVTAITRGMGLAFLACAVTTAVFFVDGHRIDYVIYGRYVVPAMVPLVACGALAFLEGSRRRMWIVAIVTALMIALLTWMFAHLMLPSRTRWMPENVIGFFPTFRFAGGVYPVAIAAYFIIFFAILEVARLRSTDAAITSFILINLAIAGAFIAFQLRPEGRRRDQDRVLVRAVAKIEASRHHPLCVDISPSLDTWHIVDYRFWLYRNLPQARNDGLRCINATIAPLSPGPSGAWQLVAKAWARPTGLFVELDPQLPQGTR